MSTRTKIFGGIILATAIILAIIVSGLDWPDWVYLPPLAIEVIIFVWSVIDDLKPNT